MAVIGGQFSVVESSGFILFPFRLPFPFLRVRTRPVSIGGRFGVEEPRVVSGRGDLEAGVRPVQDSDRVHEDDVGAVETVDTGIKKRF